MGMFSPVMHNGKLQCKFLFGIFQAQEHMERYLVEEWTLRETDLLRERGLWGPLVGSRLRKWMLDFTEGTCSKCSIISHDLVLRLLDMVIESH